MTRTTVTLATARAVLALYAEVYQARTSYPLPTGRHAARHGAGPELMIPEAMQGAADLTVCDTTGYGVPTIVWEGEVGYCACCYSLDGCLTSDVRTAAEARGLDLLLEPYASWAVNIYPA